MSFGLSNYPITYIFQTIINNNNLYPYLGVQKVSSATGLTIGQNCSFVCTNDGDHTDAFLNDSERCKAPHVSRGLLSRQKILKQSKRRDLFFVIPVGCRFDV